MTEESSIISRCKERFATAESRLNFGLCEVPSRAVLLKRLVLGKNGVHRYMQKECLLFPYFRAKMRVVPRKALFRLSSPFLE